MREGGAGGEECRPPGECGATGAATPPAFRSSRSFLRPEAQPEGDAAADTSGSAAQAIDGCRPPASSSGSWRLRLGEAMLRLALKMRT